MKTVFIDTNHLLRLLIRDNEEQYTTVYNLFNQAIEEKIKIITNTVVMFETFWVLSSFYKQDKVSVITLLCNITRFTVLKIENREVFESALLLYEHATLSLEDCYNIIYATVTETTEFGSFDKKAVKKFQNLHYGN